MEDKKTVGTNKQNQLKKQYEEQLKNGTKVKIKMCLEADDFNELDFEEILSRFAAVSHNFYLHAAENINNKLL